MTISAEEFARLQDELDQRHRDLGAAWSEVATPLDPSDADSRERWIERRRSFFDDIGPVPGARASREKLHALKDRYRGERIFVIGNGPSLNRTPLHLLEHEYTFGVNRIGLLFERLTWRPTFYTTLDWRVAPDCLDEINSLEGMTTFFPERFRGLLREGDDVTWYLNSAAIHPSERGFATEASLGIRGAGSVTGAAIQLAFHMGFDPIYLIGCDVSYRVPDTVIQEGPDVFGTGVGLFLTSTQDDDANHFDKRYFGAGRKWHDPNVERMIEGFGQCHDGATRHGRRIVNATVGGNLEVFPRVEFRSLFAPRDEPVVEPSPAALAVASVLSDADGLMVDIGAGSGSISGPFAASGWEVRAFEPACDQRERLIGSFDPMWPVFVDPRAVDVRSGATTAYADPAADGVSLAPVSAESVAVDVVAVAPTDALELVGPRSPAVLAVSANGWESDVLSAWPFDTARPDYVLVEVDDRTSPRFGFDRGSVRKFLASLGYEVVAFDGPSVSATTDGYHAPESGGAVTLVGVAESAAALVIAAEATTRTRSIMATLHGTAEPGTKPAPASAVASGSGIAAGARDVLVRRNEDLERALQELRASTSWKLGNAIVRPFGTLLRRGRTGRLGALRRKLVRR